MGEGVGFGRQPRGCVLRDGCPHGPHTRGWPSVRDDQAAVAARKDLWVLDHLERVVREYTAAPRATKEGHWRRASQETRLPLQIRPAEMVSKRSGRCSVCWLIVDMHFCLPKSFGEPSIETIDSCQQMDGTCGPPVPEGQGDFHPCQAAAHHMKGSGEFPFWLSSKASAGSSGLIGTRLSAGGDRSAAMGRLMAPHPGSAE